MPLMILSLYKELALWNKTISFLRSTTYWLCETN